MTAYTHSPYVGRHFEHGVRTSHILKPLMLLVAFLVAVTIALATAYVLQASNGQDSERFGGPTAAWTQDPNAPPPGIWQPPNGGPVK